MFISALPIILFISVQKKLTHQMYARVRVYTCVTKISLRS